GALPILLIAAFLAGPPGAARGDDWPQWLGPHRDGVWREQGILDRFPKDGPRVRWRRPVHGGYAGPAVAGGRVYVTDRVLPEGPGPVWGFAAHPLLDGDRLICLVGGEGSVVVAFDKDSGKERWRALSLESAEVGYCPPMIYQAGGKRQLIIWHPEAVNSLDPA